jgi:cytochrome c oxidase subunit II
MPLLVRRRLFVALLVVASVALAAAGVAAATNGGFTPEQPHSPNVHKTIVAYYVILGFTAAIFLIVEISLVVFLVKYRSRGRPRTDEGVQLHGHTRLEVIWTVIPVLILAVIGTVVFIELPGITGKPASAAANLQIVVEGHQFYWQFDYPNGARTINDLYIPVGRVVDLKVVSSDVVHSWWIPQLQGKIQAIPGRVNHTWFKAARAGNYYGQCAELCGPFHESMRARVIATSQAEYDSYISKQARVELGKAEFQGVCATCHGMQGQGGYGPAIASNSLLTQKAGLEAIVRNGRGLMPPVGNTWTNTQMNALVQYTRTHIYKGASTSGG